MTEVWPLPNGSVALCALVTTLTITSACQPPDAHAPSAVGVGSSEVQVVTPAAATSQSTSTSNLVTSASSVPVTSPAPPSPNVGDSSVAREPDNDPAETAALATMSDTQRAVLLAVKACLERGLRKNEEPHGSMAIELTLAADGSVAILKLAEGYPPGIRACIQGRLGAVQFPKGEGMRVFRIPINETSQTQP